MEIENGARLIPVLSRFLLSGFQAPSASVASLVDVDFELEVGAVHRGDVPEAGTELKTER